MSNRTPVRAPAAPSQWRPSPDQMSRVAQDPRLHKLSRDELYLFFNPPQAPQKGGNFFANLANNTMRKLGMPENWFEQSMAWHPKGTIERASNALEQARARRQ